MKLRFSLAALLGAVLLGNPSAEAQPNPGTSEAVESVDRLGPAATERRVQELRRYVREDLARKNWERARRNLGELVSLRPREPDYQVTLGLVFRELGNLPEARRKYRDYVESIGDSALASLLLAETFAASNQRDLALEHLEKSATAGMNVMQAVQQFPSLESFTTDTRFIRLALRLENYELENGGEDPFTPQARKSRSVDVVGKEPKNWTREKQGRMLSQAKREMQKIEYALRSQDEDSAMEAYKNLQTFVPYLEYFTEPDLAAEFRAILDRISEIEVLIQDLRLTYLYDQARFEIEKMERAFRNRDFPLVDKIRVEVDKLAQNMDEMDSSFAEVSLKVRSVADQWANRARTWREFNSRETDIQGIVISAEDTYAIVNNRILRIGDVMADMQVIRVEPNQVWFVFQGEKIPRVFRRY